MTVTSEATESRTSRIDAMLDAARERLVRLSAAEIRWMIDREWAQTSDDILWRRSKLGLHFTAEDIKRLDAFLDGIAVKPALPE